MSLDSENEQLDIKLSNCEREQGVHVDELDEHDAAWRAGLRVGDVLVSLDGALVDDHVTCMHRLLEPRRGGLEICFFRDQACAGESGGRTPVAVPHGTMELAAAQDR